MEMEAANNMDDDSSLFMQWAMDTLLQEEEPSAAVDVGCGGEAVFSPLQALNDDATVDDVCGEVVFPSLQALRDASHAAEMVRELMAVADAETHDVANSWTTSGPGDGGEVADGGSSGATGPAAPAAAAATDYYGGGSWPPQSPNSSFERAPPPPPPSAGNTNTSTSLPTVSWNFVTGSAQPSSEGVLEEDVVPTRSLPPKLAQRRRSPPPPPRRAHPYPTRSMGARSSASCTPDHIVAERKRREKINKRLIELSTVIPGLKKMDKATILSDAAKYVRELQQRLKALEDQAAAAGAGTGSSSWSKAPPTDENNGGSLSPTSASSPSGAPALPEIEARFSERSAMVRIHCGGGKGVAAAALAVVEGLGLTVVHANVMPFSACTISINITAEMEGRRRLTLTTEQIVGELKSALSHQRSIGCSDAEETEN